MGRTDHGLRRYGMPHRFVSHCTDSASPLWAFHMENRDRLCRVEGPKIYSRDCCSIFVRIARHTPNRKYAYVKSTDAWIGRLFYAFFIPYFYIQIYARFQGLQPGIADYLVAILNAMNIPARIIPAIFADRYGT